jgi:nicotinamidase-related amidase
MRSSAPGSPALEIYPVVAPKPGETVIKKHMPGSFTGTPLEEAADGSIIPHDQVHRTHLASLNGFLAQVTTTDQVVK